MADVHNTETRSFNMSRIQGKNTKPEMLVRKYLHSRGFRYKLHDKSLPGKPDIVLPKYRTVIFVHGCFWHSHKGCKYFKIPQTRTNWWKAKLSVTEIQDREHQMDLRNQGWRVIVVWECALKGDESAKTLARLIGNLRH